MHVCFSRLGTLSRFDHRGLSGNRGGYQLTEAVLTQPITAAALSSEAGGMLTFTASQTSVSTL